MSINNSIELFYIIIKNEYQYWIISFNNKSNNNNYELSNIIFKYK